MNINEIEMRKAIRRLMAVFPGQKTEDEHYRAWHYVFDGEHISNTDLMRATSDACKAGGRFMPNAGQILQRALVVLRESGNLDRSVSSDWNQKQEGPCPTCGATLRMLEPEEQVHTYWDDEDKRFVNGAALAIGPKFGILHDRRKHTQAKAPAVGFWR